MRARITQGASWVGMLGITLFYPIQNWRAITSGETTGLSETAFACLLFGTLAFTVLGLALKNWQLATTNAVGSVFTITLLTMMLS